MNNDSSSAEDRCSRKPTSNESKSSDSVDYNSNALVEPNRETAADIGRDDSRPASSAVNQSASGVSQAAASGTDAELTSVAHMLDVASAESFRTLLSPSLTPPKTGSTVARTGDKAAMFEANEDVQSTAEAIARDIIHRNKVYLVTYY